MGKRLIGVAAVLVAGVATGCSMLGPQVPKCSDEETLDLVRQIMSEQFGFTGTNEIPIETLRRVLSIELPHATSLEENIKKYTCEATLHVKKPSGDTTIPITYTSQLDDNDQHLVHGGGFNQLDLLVMTGALKEAIQAQQQQQAKTEAPVVEDPSLAAANAADAALAADAAQTAGLTEEVANTPEQVAENAAIRNRIFSGTGEDGTPKFTDFPVVEIYAGPTAKLDTSSEEARTFKTRISEALSKDPVDFAGEYTSAGWGCGTMCGYTTFVSKRTGQIIKSGLGGEMGPRVVNFVPNSEMVIAEGGEVDDDFNSTGNYAFFYRLQNNELVLIKQVPVPKEIY